MIRVLSGCIFLALSYLLYLHVSPIQSHCDIDSKAYLERAELFYATNSLAKPGETEAPYFALGYSFIMGIMFKLFGCSKDIIVWMQVLLALITGLLIYVIATRLFNRMVGGIAGLFFACNLGFLVFSQFILTEIVLVFFLTLCFERLTAFVSNQKISSLLGAGAALGTSLLIKPAAIYFPILLIPMLCFVPGSWQKKITGVIVFSMGFLGLMGTYALHNKHVFGSYNRGNLDQINIYFWFFPHVLAQKHGTNSDIEREKLIAVNEKDPLFKPVKTMFWHELKQNPHLFIFAWLKNVFKTCVGLYTTNLKVLVDPSVHGGDISFFRLHGSSLQKIHRYIVAGTSLGWVHVVGYAEAVWSIIRYLLCALGLYGIIITRRYAILYLFLSHLFYYSMITGHDGCARFRMLFEFILIILAAYGLWLMIVQCRGGLFYEKYKKFVTRRSFVCW